MICGKSCRTVTGLLAACYGQHRCQVEEQYEEEEQDEKEELPHSDTPKPDPNILQKLKEAEPTTGSTLMDITGDTGGKYTFRGALAYPVQGGRSEVTGTNSFQLVAGSTSPASPASGGTASTRCPNSVPPVARLTRKERKKGQVKKKRERQKRRKEEENVRRERDYQVELRRLKGAGLVRAGEVEWKEGEEGEDSKCNICGLLCGTTCACRCHWVPPPRVEGLPGGAPPPVPVDPSTTASSEPTQVIQILQKQPLYYSNSYVVRMTTAYCTVLCKL